MAVRLRGRGQLHPDGGADAAVLDAVRVEHGAFGGDVGQRPSGVLGLGA